MNKILLLTLLVFVFGSGQETEYFSDAEKVIVPKKFKINIVQKSNEDVAVVNFKLYSKSGKSWKKIQDYSFKKQPDFPLLVTTDEDLNNDGFNDLKISYTQVGRGANSLEKLFVFDATQNKLIDITNSQEYPNLHYNKKRNCINSFAFYDGNSTHFLKIYNKELKAFARVDFYGDTVYSYRIKDGIETLIKKMAYKTDDEDVFFSNFDPIEK